MPPSRRRYRSRNGEWSALATALRHVVRARVKEGKTLKGLEAKYENLERLLFRDIDLSESLLFSSSLANCRFRSIAAEYADWRQSDFGWARFDRIHVRESSIINCRVFSTTWYNCELMHGSLEKCDLAFTHFHDSTIENTALLESQCGSVAFNRSSLRHCDFERCDLGGATFNECDLTAVRFADCRLSAADFISCQGTPSFVRCVVDRGTALPGQRRQKSCARLDDHAGLLPDGKFPEQPKGLIAPTRRRLLRS